MEVWNPYKFTNSGVVVTILLLIILIVVLASMVIIPCQHRKKLFFRVLILFWLFTALSATYLGRPETGTSELRLELFWTIRAAWNEHNGVYWYLIIGNILLFVPLGFLLPMADQTLENCVFVTLIGGVLSFTIEVTQYVTTTGLCELDDLLHNMLGTFTGYQIFVVSSHLLGMIYDKRHTGVLYRNKLWKLSLFYLLGLGAFFVLLLYKNKPVWEGVLY